MNSEIRKFLLNELKCEYDNYYDENDILEFTQDMINDKFVRDCIDVIDKHIISWKIIDSNKFRDIFLDNIYEFCEYIDTVIMKDTRCFNIENYVDTLIDTELFLYFLDMYKFTKQDMIVQKMFAKCIVVWLYHTALICK